MSGDNISLQEALARGLAAHRAGQLGQAEQIYKSVLRAAPRSFDALHLLGVLKAASGAADEADRLLKKALTVEPSSPDGLNSRANVLQSLGRYEEALSCANRALQLRPEFPEALNNRGSILHDLKRLDEALASLDQALALRPGYAKALNNRGIVLQDLRRQEEALACFDRALAIDPNSAEAHNNRGRSLHDLKRLDEALAAADRAVALRTGYAKAFHNRGLILQDLKRLAEALASFDRALTIDPQSAEALNSRGIALHELGRYQDALSSIDKALRIKPRWAEALVIRARILLGLRRFEETVIACESALGLKPDLAEALNNRGCALRELSRSDEALASFKAALAMDPTYAKAIFNQGVVLDDLHRPEEALSWIDRALSIEPDWAEGLFERGNVLRSQSRHADAITSFEQAIAIEPDHAMAHAAESLSRLVLGDMPLGWEKFEWRWRASQILLRWNSADVPIPHSETPPWLGREDIAGKTILLHAEQGLGDTIQFCRYAALVKAKGARIILEVQPELKSLMRSLNCVDLVIARGERAPPFDLHCPLLSLPLAFGTTVETIPCSVPYMTAEPDRVVTWQERMKCLADAKVGLVWSGNPRPYDPNASRTDRRRSMRLDQFAALAQVPNVAWISLQKGEAATQAAAPPSGMAVIDWSSELKDFADTAALVEGLDLVISVDTSVAHLAGALGKPVWLLNRFDTCWRWLLDREDTPWYPTMRIFRQPSLGDWESVMQRVAAELAGWIADRGGETSDARIPPLVEKAGPVDASHVGYEAARS